MAICALYMVICPVCFLAGAVFSRSAPDYRTNGKLSDDLNSLEAEVRLVSLIGCTLLTMHTVFLELVLRFQQDQVLDLPAAHATEPLLTQITTSDEEQLIHADSRL